MAIITTDYGPRFYYDEESPEIMYPGVTNIKGMIPKDMGWWHGQQAAEAVLDRIDWAREYAEVDRKAAVKWFGGAADRYKKYKGDLGTEAHDAFERQVRALPLDEQPERIERHVENFNQFLQVVQPELVRAEDIAWSDEHQYAGSFDAQLRVKLDERGKLDVENGTPHLLLADWKTSNRVYEDVALQLVAYAMAETVVDPQGNREAMPEFTAGAVLHVTEDGWSFRIMKLSPELFEIFLGCRDFYDIVRRWQGEGRGRTRIKGVKDSVWGPTLASSKTFVTGTQRRA